MRTANELFVGNLLTAIFPHAYLAYDPRYIQSKAGGARPDFVFGWPERKNLVYLEVTTSRYPGNDRKVRQRGILLNFAETHFEYDILILYLQNLSRVGEIISSLSILEDLARGSTSTVSAQSRADRIAITSNLPANLNGHNVNWDQLFKEATAVIPQRH